MQAEKIRFGDGNAENSRASTDGDGNDADADRAPSGHTQTGKFLLQDQQTVKRKTDDADADSQWIAQSGTAGFRRHVKSPVEKNETG